MTSFVHRSAFVLLWLLVIAGIYVRFVDLGRWPLTVDEYYIGQSVFNILLKGIPEFDCGGYYTRGLLQQYLTVPFLVFSSDPEWALRMVPALFNVLAFPAVYLLGKRLGGHVLATAATVLFSLSVVEVEMARFARMYAPFQALFLWQIYFLMVYLQDRKRWAFIFIAALAGISIFVYDGAVFMVLVALTPFVLERKSPSVRQLIWSFLLFFLVVLSQFIDFRQLGAISSTDILGDYTRTRSVLFAPVMLGTIFNSKLWIFLSIIPFLLFFRSLYYIIKTNRNDFIAVIGWIIVTLCAIFNQYFLAVSAALLFFLGNIFPLSNSDRFAFFKYEPVLSFVFASFIFWTFYGYLYQGYSSLELIKIYLKVPDIFFRVIIPWFSAMPVTTIILMVAFFYGLWFCLIRDKQEISSLRLLSFISLGLFILIGLLDTTFKEARYTFFLYPVMILFLCHLMFKISGFIKLKNVNSSFLFFLMVSMYVFSSEDYSFNHLLKINSPEINYRVNYSPSLTSLYYPRRDYLSPSQYINDHRLNDDIVITTVPVVDFYLNDADYRFESYKSGRFRIISACGGTREIWSNLSLLSRDEDLFDVIDSLNSTVWIVAYSELRQYRTTSEVLINDRFRDHLVFTGVDRAVNVYRLPAKLHP